MRKAEHQPAGVPGAPATSGIALRLDSVQKQYGSGPATLTALNNVSLALYQGSFTAIMGPSGSGKSTLLHLASGLDKPTRGSVHIGSTDISQLSGDRLTQFRRDHVGFIFQAYNLLPTLSVEQNITLPLILGGKGADSAWLEYLANAVGIGALLNRRPAELSGGQQQRVAIARALISHPEVVFADEPTGALDSRSARAVLDLLWHLARELNQTIVMVTHDPVVAAASQRVIFLADGQLAGYRDGGTAAEISDFMTGLEA